MDDKNQNPNGANEEPKKEAESKTFTQEDIDKLLSERLERERKKQSKLLEQKIKEERENALKEAKMSEEERIKSEEEKRRKEFEERERALTIRENKAEAFTKLKQSDIPEIFADYLDLTDSEKLDDQVKNLKKIWDKSIDEAIEKKLQGKAPKNLDDDKPKIHNDTKNYI